MNERNEAYSAGDNTAVVDVAVIGAGPAGLTAAVYVRRAGATVKVFEGASIGGQISAAENVENFPGIRAISGMDLAMNLYEQAEALGAEFEFEAVTGAELDGAVKQLTSGGRITKARTVIIATGARCRRLGVEREDELVGAGVSYCAVCDGAFFKEKDVAVVGGGNSAVDDALYLAGYCNKVYLVHRRDGFRCENSKLELAKKNPKIEFLTGYRVIGLEGDKTLSGVVLEAVADGSKRELRAEGIFVAIGREPQNEFLKGIELKDGYVAAGENCRTNIEGVFVAGDCRDKGVRQLTTACADGTVAALAACEYLKSIK